MGAHRWCRGLGPRGRNGAQVQPLQKGAVDVPVEVEEEAHPPLAEETQEDAPALEVKRRHAPAQRSGAALNLQPLVAHLSLWSQGPAFCRSALRFFWDCVRCREAMAWTHACGTTQRL